MRFMLGIKKGGEKKPTSFLKAHEVRKIRKLRQAGKTLYRTKRFHGNQPHGLGKGQKGTNNTQLRAKHIGAMAVKCE